MQVQKKYPEESVECGADSRGSAEESVKAGADSGGSAEESVECNGRKCGKRMHKEKEQMTVR